MLIFADLAVTLQGWDNDIFTALPSDVYGKSNAKIALSSLSHPRHPRPKAAATTSHDESNCVWRSALRPDDGLGLRASRSGQESVRGRCQRGKGGRVAVSGQLRFLSRAGRARWRARAGSDASAETPWQCRCGFIPDH